MTFMTYFILTAIATQFVNGGYVYKTEYFTVPVDHFNFANNDTFRIKYLINDTFWDPNNGPIFFYTGNEGAIESYCESTGFMWDIAEEFNAMVVFAEHRYYGVSLPYGEKSYDDNDKLGYLNSEQALADFTDLITYLRQNGSYVSAYQNRLQTSVSNPVIAFGGSYGGMLAAWFRMKYPAIIEGSIASSAAIWLFTGLTPCNDFYRIASSVYTGTSVECGLTISASWKAIDNVTKSAEGKAWLSQKWKLCNPLNITDDVTTLKSWIAILYISLAMYNYPYPANVLTPLPGYPVKEVCKFMTNHKENDFTLLGSVFKGLNVYFNYTGRSECLNTSISYPSTVGVDGWDYQTCTELIMPSCSNGITDIFEENPWNIDYVNSYCNDTYSVTPLVHFIEKTYGGKYLKAASNIIFSNGLLDPWSSGGVLHNISRTVRSVIIPDSAHHLDLRSSNEMDPISVVEARNFYKDSIREWISKYQKS